MITEGPRWVQWWLLKSVAGLEQCIQRGEEVEGRETRLQDSGEQLPSTEWEVRCKRA